MKYSLRHLTTFTYAHPVTLIYNTLHLKPRALPGQRLESSKIAIDPEPVILTESIDYFGNITTYFSVQEPHDIMRILVESEVDVDPPSAPAGDGIIWNQSRQQLEQQTHRAAMDAYQYIYPSPMARALAQAKSYALPSCLATRTIHHVAIDLMHRIYTDFTFDPKATTISTPVEEVLKKRRGVCQDFAHLMICCLRSLGLSARYVSGYIQTKPPPGKPRLAGADASHAWVSVYCPLAGWLDLDPTNNQPANEQYITLGWGRDYQDVSPVRGVLFGGGDHTVLVQVDMISEEERNLAEQQKQQQQ